jgi:hypothetical protein
LTRFRSNACAGLEAVALGNRAAGCDQLQSMSTWAPLANGHGNGDGGGHARKERIAVIGSGNWGSVAAKLVASNARSQPCFHGMRLTLLCACANFSGFCR